MLNFSGRWQAIYWRYRNRSFEFSAALTLLQHRDDLQRLICWSRRKGRYRVRHYYEKQLAHVEFYLMGYRLRSRSDVEWAEWLHSFHVWLFPKSDTRQSAERRYVR